MACTINMITIVIDDYKHITNVNDASGGMLQIVGTLFIVIYNCKLFIVQATVASLTNSTENINKLVHFQNTTF